MAQKTYLLLASIYVLDFWGALSMWKSFCLNADHWRRPLLCLLTVLLALNVPRTSAQPENVSPTGHTQLDPASANWDAKDKYFLVVAASKTAGQNTDLPYAKVDANKISTVLTGKGYRKLDTLTDTNATRENFIENLKRIRTLKENGLVVIYYSGHGAIDPEGRDLWLQLYGQKYFGESQGLSVSELVRIARGGSYKGELVVIIDACYSAQGAWTKSLSLSELENTLIFASSSRTQQSLAVDLSRTETMSAFTYYLMKGLTEDWDVVDENHDGIVLYEDLQTYIAKSLTELMIKSKGADVNMTPEISGQQAKIWAAFDPTKAQNLTSLLRQQLSLKSSWKAQLANLAQQNPAKSLTPPTVSPEARLLARRVPTNADAYTRALQSIAENRYGDALKLLDIAEKTHVGELIDVYQARGNALVYQGQFMEGKKWYEAAMRINKKNDPELYEEASILFLMLSDFARAEALVRQALEIRGRAGKPTADLAFDLAMLGMLQFVQGKFDELEQSIGRIQELDLKLLDKQEPGLSLVPKLLLVLLQLVKGNLDDAQRVAKELVADAEAKLMKNHPLKTMSLFFLAIVYADAGKSMEFQSVASRFIAEWEQALRDDDLDQVCLFISFGIVFGEAARDHLGSSDLVARLEAACKDSIELIRREDDPRSPILGAALGSLALVYAIQGKLAAAEPLFLEAIEASNRAYGKINMQSILIQANLGMLYTNQRRYNAAEQSYKASLSIAETTGSGLLIFMGLEGLADLSEREGKDDEAARYYERAIKISQEIWRDGRGLAGDSALRLAGVYQRQRKYADSERLYKQALATTKNGVAIREQDSVSLLVDLGSLYFVEEKYPDAESVLRTAVANLEKNEKAKVQDMGICLVWLSEVSRVQNQFARAKELFDRFLVVCDKLSTATERDAIGGVLVQLGKYYVDKNRDSDALRMYQQVVTFYRNAEGNRGPEVAVRLYDVARFFTSHGDYEKAEQAFKQTIEIDEKALGNTNIEVAVDLEGLADLYSEMDRYEEAIQLHIRAIEIREEFPGEIALAISLSRVGRFYICLNRYREAEASLTRASAILETAQETNSTTFSGCLVSQAIVSYASTQENAKAQKLLLRALSIDEHVSQKEPQFIAEDLRLLADVYRFQQHYQDSEKALERARRVIEHASEKNRSANPAIMFNFVLLYEAEGKHQQAQKALTQALQVSFALKRREQARLLSWLKTYASTMGYMNRRSEELTLRAAAEEISKKIR